jgi:hypothetical protein
MLANFVADGGFHREFLAGGEAEADGVLHATGDPSIGGDVGEGSEAHAGGAADHVEDCRDSGDAADGREVGRKLRREGRVVHARSVAQAGCGVTRQIDTGKMEPFEKEKKSLGVFRIDPAAPDPPKSKRLLRLFFREEDLSVRIPRDQSSTNSSTP